ncbi:MAG: MFS transporter [Candidatus Eremiobacteraeota bacterium]|nr:MFS transporter [Candidatus Eremiobacteraeota bacterium]
MSAYTSVSRTDRSARTRVLPSFAIAGTRGRALAFATLAFFGGFAGVAVFGPLVPKFKDLLGLSPLAAAVLAAAPNLTGSLLRIPFGAAVERLGGKRPFLALLGVTIVGMIGLLVLLATSYPAHMAGTYPLLLGLGILIGAGVATFSVGVAQVSFWFPKREQGGALGTYGGLGNTSPGLSTIFLPLAVGALGIVAAYQIWLGVLVAITLAYALFAHDAPVFQARRRGIDIRPDQLAALGGGEMMPSATATRALANAAREPVLWALIGFYFLSFGGFLALTAWLPTYWHNMYGASLRDAALLTAAFALVSAIFRVFGGVLSDRLPIRFALGGNFILIAAGLFVVAFSGSLPLSLAGTIAAAAGMGLQNAIVFKLVPIYVTRAVGGAAGWIGGLGALGGFVLPPLMGLTTGLIGGPHAYALGFLPIAILAVLALPPVVSLEFWNRAHRIAVS